MIRIHIQMISMAVIISDETFAWSAPARPIRADWGAGLWPDVLGV